MAMWSEEWGFVLQRDHVPCTLGLDRVVCWTSFSIKHHFETKHGKAFKGEADKAELIKRGVSRYGK